MTSRLIEKTTLSARGLLDKIRNVLVTTPYFRFHNSFRVKNLLKSSPTKSGTWVEKAVENSPNHFASGSNHSRLSFKGY